MSRCERIGKRKLMRLFLPTQMKELSKEVDDLKMFKTKSTTVWVVIQIVFGICGYFIWLVLEI